MISRVLDPWDVQLRTPWDVAEIELTPLDQLISARTTFEAFEQAADRWPDRLAYRFVPSPEHGGAVVDRTFGELFGDVLQTANFLHDLGLGRSDLVAMFLLGSPRAQSIIFGTEAAAIAAPVNYLLELEQLVRILGALRVKALFTPGPDESSEIWQKALELRRALPDLKLISTSEAEEGAISLEDAASSVRDRPTFAVPTPGEQASCFHTGGTTGTPKFTPHTHANEAAAAWVDAVAFGCSPADVLVNGLPLFHIAGVLIPFVALSTGTTVVQLGKDGFRDMSIVRNLWDVIEQERATILPAVPTMLSRLAAHPVPREKVRSVRHVLCGSAPLPVAVLNDFEHATGIPVLECWGMTEATLVVACNPRDGERRPGSVGLRLPFVELAVHPLGHGDEPDGSNGAVGVLGISGPLVFPGYADSALNESTWLPDGSLNSGDLGRFDDDGYLWLVGRSKDLILRGGHNIDPAVVEDPLHRHPAVALCAAVGKPSRDLGEVPIAYVTLKPGADVTERELLDYAAGSIQERAAVPKEIVILPQLPVSGVGKVLKVPLRQDASERALRDELRSILPETVDIEFEWLAAEGDIRTVVVNINGRGVPLADDVRRRAEHQAASLAIRSEIKWTP